MGSFVGLNGASEYESSVLDADATSTPGGSTQGRTLPRPTDFGEHPVGARVPRWESQYARLVAVLDLLAVLCMFGLARVLELGDFYLPFGDYFSLHIGLVVLLLTAMTLRLNRVWDQRVLGQGSEEFTRLIRGFVSAAVVVALIGLALEVRAVRPWVFGLLPLAGLLSLIGRFAMRKWLHRQRGHGRFVHPMLAVGTVESVRDMIGRTRRDPQTGWIVRGACTPTGTGPDGAADIMGVPVVGDLDAVAGLLHSRDYRVVSIGHTPGWTGRRLHNLAWDVEGLGTDLVVDPGLMEMAGPRLHVAPVDGLPLLRLTQPTFEGGSRVLKSIVDRLGAALLLILFAPLLVVLALAVKCDGGPIFFRQTRVGRHGKAFSMIKLRSMCVDAEARKAALLTTNEGSGPLFKLRADPRVTKIGATLRRYSLVELPQLFNVLTGAMSLVGPRPPLPDEVAKYSRDAERKFLVKPALTGLWQVSGRSNLSWEQSVRLDLRYVENWTLAMDALILWKTVGAMVRGGGAY